MARCSCGSEVPSSSLVGDSFFEFLGEGSREAVHSCKHCGFHDVAHADLFPINPGTDRPNPTRDHEFESRGDVGHDRYYNGCRGWD